MLNRFHHRHERSAANIIQDITDDNGTDDRSTINNQDCSVDNHLNHGINESSSTFESNEEAFQKLPWRIRAIVQFNINHFGPALGFSAVTRVCNALGFDFGLFTIPDWIWIVLWFVTSVLLALSFILYILRIIIFPQGVLLDFRDNTRVNFFAAPLIVMVNLLVKIPTFFRPNQTAITVFFYVLFIYQLLLSLYIYGEWLFGRRNILGQVHPLYNMAIIGYLVLVILGAQSDQRDAAVFCQSVGLLFWLLIFFALFQRLASSKHGAHTRQHPGPMMFLFVAPLGAAALSSYAMSMLATTSAASAFYMGLSEFFIMIDSFVYLLLLRLLPTFWTNTFTMTMWAYVFPLSTASTAMIGYSIQQQMVFWDVIAVIQTLVAVLACTLVACFTVYFTVKGKIPQCVESRQEYMNHIQHMHQPVSVVSIDSEVEAQNNSSEYDIEQQK